MAKKKKAKASGSNKATGKKNSDTLTTQEPKRFAHPFFTSTPIKNRKPVPGVGSRMLDHIEQTLLPFPPPQRDPTMQLPDIIGTDGANQIEAAGAIIFHSVGDTGHSGGRGEEAVAYVMGQDYHPDEPNPAFLLHLGDVNYYENTPEGYYAQFYSPYKAYPGKVIAIPGNHDGEMFITRKGKTTSTGQPKSLAEFWANFCQPKAGVPAAASGIYREMISQPGVYWLLTTPFADIIGLYSNMAENPGFISAPVIGNSQKVWLTKALTQVAKSRASGKRKALIIAVHHPPVASGTKGSHSSSTQMLADIDDSCNTAGITPDMYLTAHAHNYQRFTRKFAFKGKSLQVPFFVAGTGGRGTQPVAVADKSVDGQFTYEESFIAYGHLTVTVNTSQIIVQVFKVNEANNTRSPYETVTVDLNTNTVSSKK